jgi:uncharacterized damage-inducible protein DinB
MPTMKAHFLLMAEYNAWANARLYEMASTLPDELYRKNVGAYFGSLHATLNHILTADRIWMRRLTGTGEHPDKLNSILFDDLVALRTARLAEDRRILAFVAGRTDAEFGANVDYRTLSGADQQQLLREVLAHFFNHQTHHRGQSHAILTALGVAEPDPLDLLVMFRQRGK